MIKSCVIGWPITHSRSPLIHNYWLRELGIAGSYERVAVEPQQLRTFLRSLKANGYEGCNVTIPHKEEALTAIDHLDQSVQAIGALNTVYVRGDETYATSTDGEGFLQNFYAHISNYTVAEKNITMLGAGGSAKAIIERLLRADVKSITVMNRTLSRAVGLQKNFGPKIIPTQNTAEGLASCDVLINTTSQGMTGQPEQNIDLSAMQKSAIVCDIVYVPLKTALLKDAEERGHRIVPGLGMLLHQAVRGFELWFGQRPTVTPELYALIARDIDPDFKS
jgi:shikimate dehydrogenase